MSNAAQSTPGPWRISGPYRYADDVHPSYRIDANYLLVASVFDHVESGEGNSRLIAAAPTMREYIAKHAATGDPEAIQILGTIDASR